MLIPTSQRRTTAPAPTHQPSCVTCIARYAANHVSDASILACTLIDKRPTPHENSPQPLPPRHQRAVSPIASAPACPDRICTATIASRLTADVHTDPHSRSLHLHHDIERTAHRLPDPEATVGPRDRLHVQRRGANTAVRPTVAAHTSGSQKPNASKCTSKRTGPPWRAPTCARQPSRT